MRAHSILIIDDDDILRTVLSKNLEKTNKLDVTQVGTLEEGRKILEGHLCQIDAILLDITLPDGNGRDFCREMRQKDCMIPIIILTGSDSEEDIVSGLEAGAHDYVAKPFNMNELLARLNVQLRLFENSDNAIFKIGDYHFYPSKKRLIHRKTDKKLHLTEKETLILKYLYRARGDTVERDYLLKEVWGYNSAVTTHTLETHIYRLRQKIDTDTVKILLTVDGGYAINSNLIKHQDQ